MHILRKSSTGRRRTGSGAGCRKSHAVLGHEFPETVQLRFDFVQFLAGDGLGGLGSDEFGEEGVFIGVQEGGWGADGAGAFGKGGCWSGLGR